ncbi:MAG: PD-(D/E)XK nuclease family protein [Planctomycetaceae bacterium]|nr:PD-(D/E)XK nuclease family protein [Planctomycetaceae bacterium]
MKKTIMREFLDWDSPLLLKAADYLINRFLFSGGGGDSFDCPAGRRFDLSSVVLALPGGSAVKRFEEILARRVEELAKEGKVDSAWFPPLVLTLGSLPEIFYVQQRPIASEETQYFAWRQAIITLENTEPETIKHLLPFPQNPNDIKTTRALGKIFASIHRELVSNNIEFKTVAETCRKMNLTHEANRWFAFEKLKDTYHKILDNLEIWDVQSARLYAVKQQADDEYQKIRDSLRDKKMQFFLVGLVDMNKLQRSILGKFAEFVTALIFAPADKADCFDEYGCLVADKWNNNNFPIPIDDSQIDVVDRSDYEADLALRKIAAARKPADSEADKLPDKLTNNAANNTASQSADKSDDKSDDGQRYAAGEISVVVADEQIIPFIKRRFKEANINTRHFKGIAIKHTPLFRFLDLVSRFIETKSFSDFVELVRHPDVDVYLRRILSDDLIDNFDYVSVLDKYYNKFLPVYVDGVWRSLREWSYQNRDESGVDESVVLGQICDVLCELLGVSLSGESDGLGSFSVVELRGMVEEMVERFYGGDDCNLTIESKLVFYGACQKTAMVLEELLPEMTVVDYVRWVLVLLESENIAPHYDSGAVSLIGWLEVVMDDSPFVVVTGMNDGLIPSYVTSDVFLPDKIRSHLKIEDNRRRFARDLYALVVIINSRQEGNVHLIGSRHSVNGDTMIPSRLLFMTDDKDAGGRLVLARRVKRFFDEIPRQPKLILSGTVGLRLRDKFSFSVPDLSNYFESQSDRNRMRITEFADYVRCPYRYYLNHVLRLQPVDDLAEELNAPEFGNLVHDVLCDLAGAGIDFGNIDSVRHFLADKLSVIRRERFGLNPRPSVAIQIERVEKRLNAFAAWQVDWYKKGNRIIATEYVLDEKNCNKKNFLQVDGDKMFLNGRIDRIDYNAETNCYTIFDYKTGDSPKKISDAVKRDGQWIDFQLPLYYYILRRSGLNVAGLAGGLTGGMRGEMTEEMTGEMTGGLGGVELQSNCNSDDAGVAVGYINLPKDTDAIKEELADWDNSKIATAIEQAQNIIRNIQANKFPLTDPPPPYSETYAPICLDGILK